MATRIPNNFRRSAEPSIASYDWTDIASGLAYKRFYFTLVYNNNRNLTNQNIRSQVNSTGGNLFVVGNSSDVKAYSSSFNLPAILKGDAYLSCELFTTASSGTSLSVSIKVQKYDGSTYTDISGTITAARNGVNNDYVVAAGKGTISKTNFQKGDKLVLNITTSQYAGLASNDADRICFIDIPFDIDI